MFDSWIPCSPHQRGPIYLMRLWNFCMETSSTRRKHWAVLSLVTSFCRFHTPSLWLNSSKLVRHLGRILHSKPTTYSMRTVVIFLKATKGKSQNRISLKQQQFLKNDKSESFLDFYLVYKYVYLNMFMR